MNGATRQFRRVLGHDPTGVCVVTASEGPDHPIGLVVGSFTSVSLDPPLVGFFPDRSSSTWPKTRKAGCFCINVLGDHQQDLCSKLASKDSRKFDGVGYHLSGLGSPLSAVCWRGLIAI